MSSGVVTWSQTAASNATADTTVNWAEGQAPSSVNDSARAMMASVAKWRDDNAGTLTTAGTSTAFTVTSNQVFASLALMTGHTIRLKFNATNGASPTLNVDGLGAKAIVTVTGTAIGTGSILANSIYSLTYSNSSTEWILHAGPTVQTFPVGTGLVFYQAAAPTGWSAAAITDKALRVVSATGGVTGGTTAFSSVFASRTILKANLPSYTLSDTLAVLTGGSINGLGVNAGSSSFGVAAGADFNVYKSTAYSNITASGSVTSGGSGTAMDFAVQYADCLICTKT